MILRIDYYLMIILSLGIMEDKGMHRGWPGGVERWRTSKSSQVKEEAQNELTSSVFWSPGLARSKTYA